MAMKQLSRRVALVLEGKPLYRNCSAPLGMQVIIQLYQVAEGLDLSPTSVQTVLENSIIFEIPHNRSNAMLQMILQQADHSTNGANPIPSSLLGGLLGSTQFMTEEALEELKPIVSASYLILELVGLSAQVRTLGALWVYIQRKELEGAISQLRESLDQELLATLSEFAQRIRNFG